MKFRRYFIAPSISPERMKRARMKVITIIGVIAMAATEDCDHHSVPRTEAWPEIRIGMVCQSDEVRIRANRNSFQMNPKVISATATRPGSAIGMTIWMKMRQRGTLSTSAASSTSTGSAWKKSRNSQTTIGIEKAI